MSLLADDWTTTDTALQIIGSSLYVVDYFQTMEIAESDEYYEVNPILGDDPDKEFRVSSPEDPVSDLVLLGWKRSGPVRDCRC